MKECTAANDVTFIFISQGHFKVIVVIIVDCTQITQTFAMVSFSARLEIVCG